MEHSFRIAIWMFLLLGFLQARPAFDGLIKDFGVTLLRNEVSCSENVTFVSPAVKIKKMGDCPGNPLTVMKDGLKRAQKECTIRNERVDSTLDVLDVIQMFYPTEISSYCTSQEAGNWTQFLTGCESLFQRLKSKQ